MPMQINKWSLVYGSSNSDPYMHPELKAMLEGICLHGMVANHPRLGSPSKPIRTSRIVGRRGDNTVVTVSGSEYELGPDVDPEWEKMFKDAEKKFRDKLKELPEIPDEQKA